MIQVQNLSFAYVKRQVLTDISLTFEKGKLYVIIGPNGSGKTTLLHTLARLHKGVGTLSVDGADYENIARRDFAQKIAILPQNRHTPDMSVYDLVSAGRYPYLDISRKMSAEDIAAVKDALAATNTEEFAQRSLKKLSGGERQRAYLAMLYAQDTPYVLLDEPTTHLDISAKFDIMNLLCDMKNNGKCVIAVLHDLDLALKYADEAVLMENGMVVSNQEAQKIVQSGKLQDVFGVDCECLSLNGQTTYCFHTQQRTSKSY